MNADVGPAFVSDVLSARRETGRRDERRTVARDLIRDSVSSDRTISRLLGCG